MAEVKTWNWEVWNEANVGYLVPATPGGNKVVDYEKIWDFAADGIRKAIPDAIVGGGDCRRGWQFPTGVYRTLHQRH